MCVQCAFGIYFSVQPKGKTDGEAMVETFERVYPAGMQLDSETRALVVMDGVGQHMCKPLVKQLKRVCHSRISATPPPPAVPKFLHLVPPPARFSFV